MAILPYAVAIAAAGVLSVRLYDRFSPRSLGTASFVPIAVGLVVAAFTVGNDWSTVAVILGLLLVGVGEGTLLTLLFNVLVSASPKRLAGDVGARRGQQRVERAGRGVHQRCGGRAVGRVPRSAFSGSGLPPELQSGVLFDDVDFVTNDELIVAGISLLSIFPALRLPKYVPDELSAEDIVSEAQPGGPVSAKTT